MKRFYKNASVSPDTGGFAVLLDGKPVKTPMHLALTVPTAALAEGIAKEWNDQGDIIVPASMLLTKFSNTALDGVAPRMDEVRDSVISYAISDLLFYRAEGPEELVARQDRAYAPVLQWLDGLGISFHVTKGLMPIEQPEPSLAALYDAIAGYDAFRLAGLSGITTLTGSACLALAVAEDFLGAEAAWDAAHIDEDFQIEKWGRDDEATLRRSERWKEMEAAARLLALLKEDS